MSNIEKALHHIYDLQTCLEKLDNHEHYSWLINEATTALENELKEIKNNDVYGWFWVVQHTESKQIVNSGFSLEPMNDEADVGLDGFSMKSIRLYPHPHFKSGKGE